MKLVALAGTNRPNNYTTIALTALSKELTSLGFAVEQPESSELELVFPGHAATPSSEALKESVLAADAIILATPEYHGGYSAYLKLMIENLGFPSSLQGKPMALLGVAAGRIGAIKSLEQLRSVAAHVGGIIMPSALSIAGVNGAFGDDGAPDAATKKQLGKFAADFYEFAKTWHADGQHDTTPPLEDSVRSSSDVWVTRV